MTAIFIVASPCTSCDRTSNLPHQAPNIQFAASSAQHPICRTKRPTSIGKWHLGINSNQEFEKQDRKYTPVAHGYDTYLGAPYTNAPMCAMDADGVSDKYRSALTPSRPQTIPPVLSCRLFVRGRVQRWPDLLLHGRERHGRAGECHIIRYADALLIGSLRSADWDEGGHHHPCVCAHCNVLRELKG